MHVVERARLPSLARSAFVGDEVRTNEPMYPSHRRFVRFARSVVLEVRASSDSDVAGAPKFVMVKDRKSGMNLDKPASSGSSVPEYAIALTVLALVVIIAGAILVRKRRSHD